MSIHLNGTKIPGYGQKVSVDLSLASEDMSGNSSHTPKAEKGDKAKSLKVQLTIKFSDEADLKSIVTMAEAKNSSGEREIYNIINQTANAVGMRKVNFTETLSIKENDGTEDWSINFSLTEYESVPEKKEARQAEKKVQSQTAKGTSVNGQTTATTTTPITDQAIELTPFEKIVKDFDTRLGGS
ncbi:hypothetical protein [Methylobacter sp. S3L5C]|uniref:baseplate complex protein n=1 Tax=Methylobacter sp. S3L5C TaxID=2839024 RepID=UPI001FAB4B20|nr:hypothetical protein [Methylobacter sp. S3L5C]UOA08621.1 hypothetical protein KKZ03_20930 [Methylobacter sp. S3L5C]